MLELPPQDPPAMPALLEKYRDRPMDLADAALVVLAERLGSADTLSVDRADFDADRLAGNHPFIQALAA